MLINTILGQQNYIRYCFSVIIIPLLLIYVGFCDGKYSDLKMHSEDKPLEYINGNNTWFTYILRFLQNILGQYFHSHCQIKCDYFPTMKYQVKSIELWLHKIAKVKFSFWTGEQITISKITHPLSTLRRLGHGENLHKHINKEYYYQKFTWKFQLYKYFRLNISFKYI